MPWGNIGTLPPGPYTAPSMPAAPPAAPAPSAPTATPTSAAPPAAAPASGGEISTSLESIKLQYAQQAAYQAYLNAKLQQDDEQVAINKAVAAADEAYQKATIEQQEKTRVAGGAQAALGLAEKQAEAYNVAQQGFERTGVASRGRLAGLSMLRQPLAPEAYATMLGLDATDPRAQTIAAAAGAVLGGGQQPGSVATGASGASAPPSPTPTAPKPASADQLFGQPVPAFLQNRAA